MKRTVLALFMFFLVNVVLGPGIGFVTGMYAQPAWASDRP